MGICPNEGCMKEPSLLHIADLSVEVAEPIVVGQTPDGLRRIIPILGGSARGRGSRAKFSAPAPISSCSARMG
jgi:hypothetical protein